MSKYRDWRPRCSTHLPAITARKKKKEQKRRRVLPSRIKGMISAQSKHCFPIVLLVFCCSLARLVPVAADEPAQPPGVVSVLKGHTETVYAVAFSPDGRYVLTGSFDKSLKLWEAA